MRKCILLLGLWGGIAIPGIAQAAEGDGTLRSAAQEWLKAAADLTRRAHRLAQNEEALALFTTDSALLEQARVMGELADSNGFLRARAVAMPQSKELLGIILQKEEKLNISDQTWEVLKERFHPGVIVSMMNGRDGVEYLAAGTLLATSRTYIQPPGWTGSLLLILESGDEYASAVGFWQSGDRTVTGTATFVRTESVDQWLEMLNLLFGIDLPCEEWSGEMLKGL